MITKGQEETFGVKDMFVTFIMVLMSQMCKSQNLSNRTLKHVQFIVLQLSLNKVVKNNVGTMKSGCYQLLLGLQRKSVRPDPDSQHAGASPSLLLVGEPVHASCLLSP